MTGLAMILVFRYPSGFYRKASSSSRELPATFCLLFTGAQNGLEGLRFRDESILETRDTPYGNLTFTERDGQVTGYLDRNPVLSSADLAAQEELSTIPHFSILHRGSFLLLGSGLSGMLPRLSNTSRKASIIVKQIHGFTAWEATTSATLCFLTALHSYGWKKAGLLQ